MQGLLARTCGHALGARQALTRFLANLVFPASLLAYAHLFADGVLTLGVASRVGAASWQPARCCRKKGAAVERAGCSAGSEEAPPAAAHGARWQAGQGKGRPHGPPLACAAPDVRCSSGSLARHTASEW